MRKFVISNGIVICLVLVILGWTHYSRLQDFRAYHTALAQKSTSASSQEIAAFIAEKKRLVALFAQDHRELINQLVQDPENEDLYDQLNDRIALYFPDYFAFTISNHRGKPSLEDFDGFIGELCINDLQYFSNTTIQKHRIHPNAEAYHFDVLAQLDKGTGAILFISFHADVLGTILSNAQASGHELLITLPEASNLIEVTDKGARINVPRNDYRLSGEEKQRILLSTSIPNTQWTVVDIHNQTLFTDYARELYKTNIVIVILFITISMIMLYAVYREEKLRRKAESAKQNFLSVISHELRTPITSIIGSLSLMANGTFGKLNKQMEQFVNIALSNSERLSLLINDLLDIQKLEADQMKLTLEVVELEALVQESIDNNIGYAEKLGVTFSLIAKKSDLQVNVDKNKIIQVLSNYLSNAAKYGCENDAIEVVIDENTGMARVSVKDHGAGIPDSFREQVFEKFSQAQTGNSREISGTGLGLSIVKAIIEKHKGRVGFESQAGKGTVFYFDLPLV